MARYRGPTLRLSRREGEDLGHKSGLRNIEEKCKLKAKPGEPAKNMRSKASDYLHHLRAKQKMRRYYNILERQFRNYYQKAANAKGDTGSNLIAMLETRLDNIVYRLGFARTRAEARQMVSHKQVLIAGQVINIPSAKVSPGLEISLKSRVQEHARVKDSLTLAEHRQIDYPWLEFDQAKCVGKLVGVPDKTALGIFFDEGMVIEYYSR